MSYMVTPFHVNFTLKGQFWNIPVSAAKLTDPTLLAQLPQPDYNHSNLYMITVKPADSPDRTFFGELFGNHWDSYKSPCLYAGNSQVRFSTHKLNGGVLMIIIISTLFFYTFV